MHRKHKNPVAIILALLMLAVSGCAEGTSVKSDVATSTSPGSGPDSGSIADSGPNISADYECGALSVLIPAQDAFKLDPQLDKSGQQYMRDSWNRVVVGNTQVSPGLRDLVRMVVSGDMASFDQAAALVTEICSKNGSPIMVMGLPGEGG